METKKAREKGARKKRGSKEGSSGEGGSGERSGKEGSGKEGGYRGEERPPTFDTKYMSQGHNVEPVNWETYRFPPVHLTFEEIDVMDGDKTFAPPKHAKPRQCMGLSLPLLKIAGIQFLRTFYLTCTRPLTQRAKLRLCKAETSTSSNNGHFHVLSKNTFRSFTEIMLEPGTVCFNLQTYRTMAIAYQDGLCGPLTFCLFLRGADKRDASVGTLVISVTLEDIGKDLPKEEAPRNPFASSLTTTTTSTTTKTTMTNLFSTTRPTLPVTSMTVSAIPITSTTTAVVLETSCTHDSLIQLASRLVDETARMRWITFAEHCPWEQCAKTNGITLDTTRLKMVHAYQEHIPGSEMDAISCPSPDLRLLLEQQTCMPLIPDFLRLSLDQQAFYAPSSCSELIGSIQWMFGFIECIDEKMPLSVDSIAEWDRALTFTKIMAQCSFYMIHGPYCMAPYFLLIYQAVEQCLDHTMTMMNSIFSQFTPKFTSQHTASSSSSSSSSASTSATSATTFTSTSSTSVSTSTSSSSSCSVEQEEKSKRKRKTEKKKNQECDSTTSVSLPCPSQQRRRKQQGDHKRLLDKTRKMKTNKEQDQDKKRLITASNNDSSSLTVSTSTRFAVLSECALVRQCLVNGTILVCDEHVYWTCTHGCHGRLHSPQCWEHPAIRHRVKALKQGKACFSLDCSGQVTSLVQKMGESTLFKWLGADKRHGTDKQPRVDNPGIGPSPPLSSLGGVKLEDKGSDKGSGDKEDDDKGKEPIHGLLTSLSSHDPTLTTVSSSSSFASSSSSSSLSSCFLSSVSNSSMLIPLVQVSKKSGKKKEEQDIVQTYQLHQTKGMKKKKTSRHESSSSSSSKPRRISLAEFARQTTTTTSRPFTILTRPSSTTTTTLPVVLATPILISSSHCTPPGGIWHAHCLFVDRLWQSTTTDLDSIQKDADPLGLKEEEECLQVIYCTILLSWCIRYSRYTNIHMFSKEKWSRCEIWK